MRKVHVELRVKLILNMDEDISVSEVLDELDYNFSDTTTKAEVEDTEIQDYEVIDSK